MRVKTKEQYKRKQFRRLCAGMHHVARRRRVFNGRDNRLSWFVRMMLAGRTDKINAAKKKTWLRKLAPKSEESTNA